MDRIDSTEAWRQIPPEEKFQIMARAHSNGILSCVIVIVTACTLAVGLRLPWLMWGSFIASPLIFQFTAGKAWRDLRPRIMLEYLAARSAARRYAYIANSKELGISLLFRGKMEGVFDKDHAQEELEATVANVKSTSVWIALFNDALVLMSEKVGGAKCEMATLLADSKLGVEAKNLDEGGDYSTNKEIYLSLGSDKDIFAKKLKLTSEHPAALIVFEKLLLRGIEDARLAKEKELENVTKLALGGNSIDDY